MKKATFISGPPGGGKWALAQQLAEPIKGNTLYISPVNINKNNLLNVLRTDDYQILFIDWPINARFAEQKQIAQTLVEAIQEGTKKDIFILSQRPAMIELKGVIEDLTPQLK